MLNIPANPFFYLRRCELFCEWLHEAVGIPHLIRVEVRRDADAAGNKPLLAVWLNTPPRGRVTAGAVIEANFRFGDSFETRGRVLAGAFRGGGGLRSSSVLRLDGAWCVLSRDVLGARWLHKR
jgi:hypothetical protein